METKKIAENYGMTLDEYAAMRQKIIDLHRNVASKPGVLQSTVYSEIEKVSVSTKEAIMITSGLCALMGIVGCS